MNRVREAGAPYLYALLRFVAGGMFAMHGSQKLFGIPGEKEPAGLLTMYGVAGVIEFFGGLLIAIGFLTPYIALLAAVLMVFAYFMAHAPQGWLPILNGGELAVLYCFVFLYIAARGGGALSLDSLIWGRRREGKIATLD
jgi:putative oxidoreductase